MGDGNDLMLHQSSTTETHPAQVGVLRHVVVEDNVDTLHVHASASMHTKNTSLDPPKALQK